MQQATGNIFLHREEGSGEDVGAVWHEASAASKAFFVKFIIPSSFQFIGHKPQISQDMTMVDANACDIMAC